MSDAARRKCLSAGAWILGIGILGLGLPSLVMVTRRPDLATHEGRLLMAGALANLCLTVILSAVALIPLRRGERWAFWALLLPVGMYGLPMLVIDATHVAGERLAATLAPQIAGLVVAAVGLALAAPAVFHGRALR